jgi:DNA (cytosine-5)-methyltransferase 1
MVFDEVQSDLETIGFEVIPFLLPAAAVNAPHRRDRIWFIAHAISSSERANELRCIRQENGEIESKGTQTIYDALRPDGFKGFIANACNVKNTDGFGQERGMHSEQSENAIRKQFSKSNSWINERQSWNNFPTKSPICNGDDGLSERLDGITFSKWRNESIKAGGNAIVPQVAFQIFKTIQTQNHDLYSMQANDA